MKTIALNRLGILTVAKGKGWTKAQQVTFLAELAKLGYRISNPDLLHMASDAFFLDYKHLLNTLAKRRGGNVHYVPLFKNFPDVVIDDNTHFVKRIIGYLGNAFDLFSDVVTLSNGTKVPKCLFNVYEFGADPITQNQSKDLFELAVRENEQKAGDTHVEWLDLRLVFDEDLETELQDYLERLVYAKSSIKEELHADLYRLLSFLGSDQLDADLVVFKETKSMLLKYFWNNNDMDAVVKMATTATDVLRMMAAVTDSDVSLNEKIKFPKLSRKARKAILSVLEASSSLPEDLKKYKGLWLEIGRYLHPFEYAKQFPRTAAIFDLLRNGKIETYDSKTELYMVVEELDALLKHLASKPGIFARKLHEVLRRFPNDLDAVLSAFEQIVAKVAVKNLLVLQAYFATINEAAYRTIINKRGKLKVMPNNAFAALTEAQVDKVVEIIQKAIVRALSEKESWKDKAVWIDPALMHYTVPLQQRKASDGIITVGRGSRIKLDFSKVLRLFIYWKESTLRTDLDLSVIQFDADFNYLGHVSYTNLSANGIQHSGDITSAPLGAAEFVDISLAALKEEVRYLAVQVYKYSGNHFADMDCHAGWMLRNKVDARRKTFDIKTVANKFDLNGKGGYAIPLMVDVREGNIIATDLYVSSVNFYNNVEGSFNDVSVICEQINNFVDTRPVVGNLAKAHVVARQAMLTDHKELADISFGVDNCTYNATDIEQILSELI